MKGPVGEDFVPYTDTEYNHTLPSLNVRTYERLCVYTNFPAIQPRTCKRETTKSRVRIEVQDQEIKIIIQERRGENINFSSQQGWKLLGDEICYEMCQHH